MHLTLGLPKMSFLMTGVRGGSSAPNPPFVRHAAKVSEEPIVPELPCRSERLLSRESQKNSETASVLSGFLK